MEYKFFKAQWDNPCPQDWTIQVQEDLVDLGIPTSLQFISSKNEKTFKALVKERVKALEFKELMDARKSKTENNLYSTLKMQKYLQLENLTKKQAIVVFKFRSRMAPFGENFRSGNLSTICPLCSAHVDSQENSLDCPTLRREVRIKGSYSDIFSENIPEDLTKTIFDIYNYRKEFQE